MWALLGRVDKDAWTATWRRDGATPNQMRADAAYEDALLRGAIDSYTSAFRTNPGHEQFATHGPASSWPRVCTTRQAPDR
jgi:hypothetical protein